MQCHFRAHRVRALMKRCASHCRLAHYWPCSRESEWLSAVNDSKEMCVRFVSTAQSLLCGSADCVWGVVDDGRGEQEPSWAAPNCTAGTNAHTHTHKNLLFASALLAWPVNTSMKMEDKENNMILIAGMFKMNSEHWRWEESKRDLEHARVAAECEAVGRRVSASVEVVVLCWQTVE